MDVQSLLKSPSLFSLVNAFLEKPYILGACGEGEQGEFDQRPLYRFDGFDCVTFVNTVLALLHAHDEPSFIHAMKKINYKQGKVAYENRHHFLCVDWNPANEAQGWIRNITPVTARATALIDKPNWLRHRTLKDLYLPKTSQVEKEKALTQLYALANQFAPVLSVVPYLSLDCIQDTSFDGMPDSLLIEIVRPNWNLADKIGTHLNMSHLGFALREKGEWFFYHASTDFKKVVKVLLYDYFNFCRTLPTVGGITVFELLSVGK
ncbi:MAG TPA: N-acetylmuramoyl-L-alanine amidase-like domain-containing protein [Coxiellaceae bacterium]|nr:N-acetylmuramoyl-L-alanine amidase-like domain-containing protein [Coxiellaceae bacterium]